MRFYVHSLHLSSNTFYRESTYNQLYIKEPIDSSYACGKPNEKRSSIYIDLYANLTKY